MTDRQVYYILVRPIYFLCILLFITPWYFILSDIVYMQFNFYTLFIVGVFLPITILNFISFKIMMKKTDSYFKTLRFTFE